MNPIIIIGAGRSGTNILRDLLCSIPGLETWPCDEINYIWRHGNITEQTDEFGIEHARPGVKKYIRKAFSRIARKYDATTIVEKTCANSLRVSFVNAIFPDARFIHIVRDGRDVANSARKRWTAGLEPSYILPKAKFIPLTDIPYYAFQYLGNRLYRFISNEGRLASWGPRFEAMNEILKNYSLEEVCAFQWKRCVEKATEELSQLEPARVYSMRYEELVLNTEDEIEKMLRFLRIDKKGTSINELAGMVHSKSRGKWKDQLSPEEIEKIESVIGPLLVKLGYK